MNLDTVATQSSLIMKPLQNSDLVRLFAKILEQRREPTNKQQEKSGKRKKSLMASEYKKRVSFDEEPVILNCHDNAETCCDDDFIQPGKRQSHSINLIDPDEPQKIELAKVELKRRRTLLRHFLPKFVKS